MTIVYDASEFCSYECCNAYRKEDSEYCYYHDSIINKEDLK